MGIIIQGINVNFGIGNVVENINGIFQTRDHHIYSKSQELTDGGDTTVSKAYWDFKEEATFTYVAYSNNGNFNFFDIPIIGTYVYCNTQTVWNASSTQYYPITGNPWIVEDVETNASNFNATKVVLKIARYPQIQN